MTLDLDEPAHPSTTSPETADRSVVRHEPSLLGSLMAALERLRPVARLRQGLDRLRSAAHRRLHPSGPTLDEHRNWALLAPTSCGSARPSSDPCRSRRPRDSREMMAIIDQIGD